MKIIDKIKLLNKEQERKIKSALAKNIRLRIRETKVTGLSGREVREDLVKLLDKFVKAIDNK